MCGAVNQFCRVRQPPALLLAQPEAATRVLEAQRHGTPKNVLVESSKPGPEEHDVEYLVVFEESPQQVVLVPRAALVDMHGYAVVEDLDLSARAAPTIDYFIRRLPQWRERLIRDLGLTGEQVDALISSGSEYRERYRDRTYGYRLFQFSRAG